MSSHLSELPVPIYKNVTNSQRPKHQSNRSIPETSFGVPKLHRPHPHIHRHHKDSKEKDAQNSQRTSYTADGGKSDVATPEESSDPSRRTSLLANGETEGLIIPQSWREGKRVVKDEEVSQEKERGVLRVAELRNALSGLNTLSNNTTRRLDNTYYSVLEKLSTLQSTIISLRELARMTRLLNDNFKKESEEVVVEVETALNASEGFEEQRKRIEALAGRVQKGREKIKTLGERVEIVKERVDGWEKSEWDWQERTRRRLKMLWIIMAACAVVVFVLVAFQYAPAKTQGPSFMKGLDPGAFDGNVPDLEAIRNETWSLKRGTADALEKMKAKSQAQEDAEEDPRLRVFDEL